MSAFVIVQTQDVGDGVDAFEPHVVIVM
jgi:hypothetical protein